MTLGNDDILETAEDIARVYKDGYDKHDLNIVFILPIMMKTLKIPQERIDRAVAILEHTIGEKNLADFEDEAFK